MSGRLKSKVNDHWRQAIIAPVIRRLSASDSDPAGAYITPKTPYKWISGLLLREGEGNLLLRRWEGKTEEEGKGMTLSQ